MLSVHRVVNFSAMLLVEIVRLEPDLTYTALGRKPSRTFSAIFFNLIFLNNIKKNGDKLQMSILKGYKVKKEIREEKRKKRIREKKGGELFLQVSLI